MMHAKRKITEYCAQQNETHNKAQVQPRRNNHTETWNVKLKSAEHSMHSSEDNWQILQSKNKYFILLLPSTKKQPPTQYVTYQFVSFTENIKVLMYNIMIKKYYISCYFLHFFILFIVMMTCFTICIHILLELPYNTCRYFFLIKIKIYTLSSWHSDIFFVCQYS